MILPTTHTSAVLLLLVSFLCLGSWINTFKLAGPRLRFELYSIDFAVGAALLSIIAAFTLGTLGSDLAFSDRLLVAGRASQAFVLAAGILFNLGNMLLLAAVSLLGVSGAFLLSIGSALVISSLFYFPAPNTPILLSGIVLVLLAVLLDIAACRMREAAQLATGSTAGVQYGVKVAAKPGLRVPPKPAPRKTGKGIFIALLSGAMLGFFYPIGVKGMTGDLALGPYAGMLMFSVGILISTVLFGVYFLKIAIEGEPLSVSAYLQGKAPQHFLGLAGGALWATGALAALLAVAIPAQAGVQGSTKLFAPLASVLLAVACGVFVWKEFQATSKAKLSLGLAAALFACGLALIGIGVSS